MKWLPGIFRRRHLYNDLAEEMRLHLEERTEQLMCEGMSRTEAEQAARRAFGNRTVLEERSREVWQWSTFESIGADLHHALRRLGRSPGFTLAALLIIGLGVGASTAVFSIVDSVLLRPYAFPDPGQIVVWRETIQEVSNRYPVLPDNFKHYLYLKAHSATIADAAILQNTPFAVAVGEDHPQIMNGLSISPNLFSVLGINPVLGRGFLPEEAKEGGNRSIVIAWSLWQRLFHGAPDVIGRTLKVKGEQRTIVGVLPATFDLPNLNEMAPGEQPGKTSPYEVFQPLVPQQEDLTSDDADFSFLVVGRLKPGVSATQATSELDGMQKAYSLNNHLPIHLGIVVKPLSQEVTGSIGKALWLLFGAVVGVLLIACVNLASLQLARSVACDRDNAVRAALGAGRERLFQATLMESFILSFVGGAAGILLAFGGIYLFRAIAPGNLPRLNEIQINWPVLLFATALCALTAILSGSLPALRSLSTDPRQALQAASTRVMSGRRAVAARRALVTFEIAGTVVLLIVTSLVARSFGRVINQHHAFNANHLMIAQVDMLNSRYEAGKDAGAGARSAFIERTVDQLHSNPGVESSAITSSMPLTGDINVYGMYRPDHPLPESEVPTANLRNISPGYFATMQTPLLSGQEFDGRERAQPDDAIISQKAAKAAWPEGHPMGKKFRTNGRVYTVIGIAADARIADLKEDTPIVYLPYWHDPPSTVFFLVRSSLAPDALAPTIRREIWNVDPEVAIPVLKSLDILMAESVAAERLQTTVLSAFGAAALILAILGVYGVLAYSVSLRTSEFGLRLALGSSRMALIRLVLWEASQPVIGGLILGVLAAMGATQAIRGLLYETRTADPASITASIALLSLAALLAAFLPAYRASKTDPMRALRED
ncbi:MAG TPA: ABC transporter permease [Terracidiphilus sp.]|jgi:predicted permease